MVNQKQHNELQKSSELPANVLTQKVFAQGIAIVAVHFPNLPMDNEKWKIWRSMLSSLTDEQFTIGVKKFCLEHTEIYPGTNVIAHIRNYGLGKKKRDLKSEAVLVYNFMRAGKLLPGDIDHDLAEEAMELALAASTGLIADERWDEKRFVELYTSMQSLEPPAKTFDILGKVRNLHIEGETI